MNIVSRSFFVSFIFSFFIASAYTMIEHNPAITTKDQAIQQFANSNVKNGLIVITRDNCGPCIGYKNLLKSYLVENSFDVNKFIFINASRMPNEYLKNPLYIIKQLNVEAAPSTFRVSIVQGRANVFSVRTPQSIQEIKSLLYG